MTCVCSLSQFSTPTRIVEAAPYLRKAYDLEKTRAVPDVSYLPRFYLAASLANIPGHEEEALRAYNRGLVERERAEPDIQQLWTEANLSRMLRRAGRLEDARKLEDMVA